VSAVFIVFGFRVLWRTIAEGRFRCPHEGTEQPFRRQRGRRWFTVFFVVPVIPLNEVGESVQCASCRRRFAVEAAATPSPGSAPAQVAGAGTPHPVPSGPAVDPAVVHGLNSHALRVAAAGLLRAEGIPDAAARIRAVKVVRGNQTEPYDEAALDRDLTDLATPPEELLWPLATHLDARGKERFLETCLEVIGKPAELTANQRAGIERLGRALGLTEANIAGVVASVR
jgi:hypothetical protein